MRRHGIPTAAYGNFSDYEQAKSYLATAEYPVVIKASGLAAGKGVIIAENPVEADEALKDMLIRSKFGSSGTSAVIEEYLQGDEISILTFSDGVTTRTLPSSQDHKRIFDGDRGPNIGGMGVIAPTPRATPEVMKRIEDEILQPEFNGLKFEGLTYTGMLFTGLMLTDSGPKVLEYNARFGCPDTIGLAPA
ncbi:Bifunctional purine biosynthetic protein ADE1 [Lecanora helva]